MLVPANELAEQIGDRRLANMVMLGALLANLPLWSYLLAVLLISMTGIWLCGESSRRLGVHDHGGIVWDEFAGFLLTMVAAPQEWWWVIVGFGLFRLFDIWKPWPVRIADRKVHGGLGIMLDDLLAGVYAWIVLQLLVYFL